MNERNEMSDELSALETRLSKLVPVGASDLGTLMFRAGLAAGARTRRCWQGMTAAAVCLAMGIAMWSATRPATQTVERLVYVPQKAVLPAPQYPYAAVVAPRQWPEPLRARGETSEFSYLRVRQQVLEHGLSALPTSGGGASGPQDVRRLMDELLQTSDANG